MNQENVLGTILENLDLNNNLQELIEGLVEENFRELDQPLYDEQGNFIYNKTLVDFLKSDEGVVSLSNDEFKLVLDMLVKDILHRIEAKGNSHIRATEGAYDEENRSYYGSSESAYWHLLEQYLDDFNYNKSISDFYAEYLEENEKKK
ncbi:MAG: hypothetical protein ACI31V_03725 [Bacilli bacterium]